MTFLKYVERGTERVDSLSLLPATIHSKVAATGIARTRNQGLELGRWLLVGRGNGSGRSQMLFRRGFDTRGRQGTHTHHRFDDILKVCHKDVRGMITNIMVRADPVNGSDELQGTRGGLAESD